MIRSFFIVLISQFTFVVCRTVNVRHIAQNNLSLTLISGTMMSALWIYTTMLGVNALNNDSPWDIVAFLLGGIAGTAIAMRYQSVLWIFECAWVSIFCTYIKWDDSHYFSFSDCGMISQRSLTTKKQAHEAFMKHYRETHTFRKIK